MTTETQYRLLDDTPNTDEHNDPLGFETVAQQLCDLIMAPKPATPFALGIEAGWGAGKSSLMGRLERRVQEIAKSKSTSLKIVSFNAWTAEGANALEGLVKSVLDAMDRNVLRKVMRKKQMIGVLRGLVYFVAGWLKLDRAVDAMWDRARVDAKTRQELADVVNTTMEEWKKKRSIGQDALVVVFIDDLDRCDAATVVDLFRAMKLYLASEGFVFVLGFDLAAITAAIRAQREMAAEMSRLYLDKVVQVTYRIPMPNDEQSTALANDYFTRSGTGDLFDEALRELILDRCARNPRSVKRFSNEFVLQYRLDAEWRDLGAPTLAQVLILETYFPDFTRLFAAREDLNPLFEFLTYVEVRDALLRRSGGQLDEPEDTTLRKNLERLGVSADVFQRPYNDALLEVERQLPEEYHALAGDPRFVELARGLQEAPNFDQLKSKLERRSEIKRAAETDAALGESAAAPPSAHGRLLWLDDTPSNNTYVVEQLSRQGWTIRQAPSLLEAAKSGMVDGNMAYDVVITDIARGNDLHAGLDDLAQLASNSTKPARTLVYSRRITPAARDEAEKLGAHVVTDTSDLIRLITDVAPTSAVS